MFSITAVLIGACCWFFDRTVQVTSVAAARLHPPIVLCSFDSPVFFLHTLASVATLAPNQIVTKKLSTLLFAPEVYVGTKRWVVGVDPFAKHRAFMAELVLAPVIHQNAVAALLPVAFEAGKSILKSAALEFSKVDDCRLVSVISGFLEWILVTPVQAVGLAIPHLGILNALARD